nr:SemiSWEET transporter [uncultured Methylotenera sp.]
MLNTTDFIGYLSAFLTTFAFVPQALHSWKTRDLSGVSLPMYSIFSLGVFGWLVYGILMTCWPIIVANSVTFMLACVVLYLKITHANQTASN